MIPAPPGRASVRLPCPMLDIRTRALCPADAESLLAMMAEFNACEGLPWPRAGTPVALQQLLAAPALGLVGHILADDQVCGYFVLTWGFDLEWSGRDAYLTELYLLPAARGRGIGPAALPLIERHAAEHGARALHLMVRPENRPALRMYLAAGYESPPRVFLSKPLVEPPPARPLPRSRT